MHLCWPGWHAPHELAVTDVRGPHSMRRAVITAKLPPGPATRTSGQPVPANALHLGPLSLRCMLHLRDSHNRSHIWLDVHLVFPIHILSLLSWVHALQAGHHKCRLLFSAANLPIWGTPSPCSTFHVAGIRANNIRVFSSRILSLPAFRSQQPLHFSCRFCNLDNFDVRFSSLI
jgi:hypothetical protein